MKIIALIFSVAVFVICYFSFQLGGKTKRQKFIEEARKKGNYKKAVSVNVERERGALKKDMDKYRSTPSVYRNPTLWVTYEYIVNGQKHIVRFMEKHIRYWNEKYAFNGEEEVIEFFNEVLDKGTIRENSN